MLYIQSSSCWRHEYTCLCKTSRDHSITGIVFLLRYIGPKKISEIEIVLNKVCRYFLGVTKHCSNVSSRGDLGWSYCEVKQKVEYFCTWCRLQNKQEHMIIRRVYDWSLAKGRSWEKKCLNLLIHIT